MALGIVVFARLSSSRLPGKALRPVAGRCLLGRVFDRIRRTASGGQIVLATSVEAEDDDLAVFAESEGVPVYRGALDDVCGRALGCVRHFGFDTFVRVCGDSPFYDSGLMDYMIRLHTNTGADMVTNLRPRSYPPGLSVEILTADALARIHALTRDDGDREHMTRAAYAHADRFHIVNHARPLPDDLVDSLCIDTPTDLARAEWIIGKLEDPTAASLADIERHAREWKRHRAAVGKEQERSARS